MGKARENYRLSMQALTVERHLSAIGSAFPFVTLQQNQIN
jgi:hypothetical protein